MRGKGFHYFFHVLLQGITPAYAGKRIKQNKSPSAQRDHPRVCGEKGLFCRPPAHVMGSPPRMRGKVAHGVILCETPGITPAYAGKSHMGRHWHCGPQDHPRVCGEKKVMRGAKDKRMGSPPRMRGKVAPKNCGSSSTRITPAYAGKRLKRSRSTVPPVAIVPLFPSVCNKPVVSDGSPAGRDAPLFLPAENAVPASPAYNLRSL